MRQLIFKHAEKYSFWLSILIHFILICFFLFNYSFKSFFNHRDDNHDLPGLSIPAYVYHGAAPNLTITQVPQMPQKIRSDPNGILKPVKQFSPSIPSMSKPRSLSKPTEPVNLIGNKKIRKPLLELLGKALTRALVYPKIALDFNLHGTSYVGFNIDENGKIDNVRLMQSSGAEVLDQAALAGVVAISPLKKANLFLKQKKFLVIGIIFK